MIIDYAYTDDIKGYMERPDSLAGRRGIAIRDEIRMVRPGFYLGRAYANRAFLLNFTLYDAAIASRACRISLVESLPRKIAGRVSRVMLQRNRLATLFGLAFVALTAPVHAASAFELLYPATNGVLPLPTPFGRLLDDLRQRSGGAEVQVAFVPLGRSLQRMAADPEFFNSPRIIAAVTRDGSTGPMLRNRLFIGYQPASGAIEIIAFDASKGRFVFQEVTQYEAGSVGAFTTHDEQGCIACHQAASPIFSASPWQETNANPAVVSALLPMYEGVNVTVDFDGLDRFDRAVRAAARLQAAAQLWRQGCKTRVCRAALIGEALRMARSANTGELSSQGSIIHRRTCRELA